MIQKSQNGFTLIELVVVIVLLGILGVTALGKFQDLSSNAEDAAVAGIASELSASSSINYANSLVGNTPEAPITHTTAPDTATACGGALLAGLFATDAFPAGYTPTFGAVITSSGAPVDNPVCDARGDSFTCTITSNSDATATATANIICTGV